MALGTGRAAHHYVRPSPGHANAQPERIFAADALAPAAPHLRADLPVLAAPHQPDDDHPIGWTVAVIRFLGNQTTPPWPSTTQRCGRTWARSGHDQALRAALPAP